jgi:hypothetical protein
MKKRLSKTGQKMWRTTKAQIYRVYMQGYEAGQLYIQSATDVDDFVPAIDKDWDEAYRDGFVDGYNDNLECMRIE